MLKNTAGLQSPHLLLHVSCHWQLGMSGCHGCCVACCPQKTSTTVICAIQLQRRARVQTRKGPMTFCHADASTKQRLWLAISRLEKELWSEMSKAREQQHVCSILIPRSGPLTRQQDFLNGWHEVHTGDPAHGNPLSSATCSICPIGCSETCKTNVPARGSQRALLLLSVRRCPWTDPSPTSDKAFADNNSNALSDVDPFGVWHCWRAYRVGLHRPPVR